MKKTYLQPETYVMKVNVSSMIMTSMDVNSDKSDYQVLVKEDNSWDIWGSAEDDED